MNKIKQAEDLLITSLKIAKKTKYNVTRKDGFRVNITKVRNGTSQYNPLTKKELKKLKILYHNNKTYKQIMEIMKISRSKVARNIQKIIGYKWEPSKEQIKKHEKSIVRLRKNGYSYIQIRKKLHIPSRLISIVLERNKMKNQYRRN